MNDLDPKTAYDPTFLFIRADERTEAVETTVRDMDKEIQHIREGLAGFRHHFDQRVENGVAVTGNRNKDEIAALSTRVALLERENGEMKKQLFDEDTGLVKQFEDLRSWVGTVNNTVIGFFIVSVAGGIILWLIQHFH